MNSLDQLSVFLQRVTSDIHLRSVHIVLYAVLCQNWIINGCKNPFNISRSKIMQLTRIKSKTTYHKSMRDLEQGGYIQYSPSYHPLKGSTIVLLSKQAEYWKRIERN